MIIVIAEKEIDELTGCEELITSHGVNIDTGEIVILPPIHPQYIGTYNEEIGEYILRESFFLQEKRND